MSKKQDYILNYIKKLETGSKVSIRTLAENLSVSEGTAYKAIKKAEELGLVHTRPRAGTIRIPDDVSHNASVLTIHEIIQHLGLSVIFSVDVDIPISSVVIGDGSINQLKNDAAHASENTLCIVGDRPEIQAEALALGMHLLITGDTTLSKDTLSIAIEKNLYVLSSQQNCCNVLYMLHNIDGFHHTDYAMNQVSSWMQQPQYLYYNDIASDWYRTYLPTFTLNDKYAVVNDDFKICGLLKAASILNASPEERISDLYERDIDIQSFTIPESSSMYDVAKKMVKENTELIFAEHDGQLKGLITANDVLRYYLYNNAEESQHSSVSLELVLEMPSENKRIYDIHTSAPIDFTNIPREDGLLSLIFEVSKDHAEYFFNQSGCELISCTFYNINNTVSDQDLKITSTLISHSNTSCICEVQIKNGNSEIFKCMLNYSVIIPK